MAQECPISAPLVLKDTQSGFAGETGSVWTIAPDCSFTIARQIGPKVLEPHKHGRLTSQQQAQLSDMMQRMTAAALPEHLGGDVKHGALARRIGLRQRPGCLARKIAVGFCDHGPDRVERLVDLLGRHRAARN